MKKKFTIKDIAKLAGVSIGTVDRVIHNRGKVSDRALAKVNDALKELDYSPNPIARTLKNNVVYKIGVLIPDPEKDPYWWPCHIGINEVVEEFGAFDLEIDIVMFDPTRPASFVKRGQELVDHEPHALLFVPLFEKESEAFLNSLAKKELLTATFNNLPRGTVDQHVGQDLFLSGRVAAKLMDDSLSNAANILITHIDEAYNNAIHMQEKEKGFRSYFDESAHDMRLFTCKWKSQDLGRQLEHFLAKNGKIDAFFVTNSKAYELLSALQPTSIRSLIVGYDLLPENISCLRKKGIRFLIHQSPKLQAAFSLRRLIEYLLFDKSLVDRQYLPIEIINSENIKSYT